MYLISIIVPVYNIEKLLPRCIESILQQTYKNIEVILVNDGSTDDSGRICEEYKLKDERIKVIHQQNQGVSAARNIGIEHSNGEFIGFVDSDDYIDNDMYEILLKNMIDNKCDISICGARTISTNGKIIKDNNCKEFKLLNRNEALIEIYNIMDSAIWNKLYRKKNIDKIRFEDGITYGEDLYFNIKALSKCEKIVFYSVSKYNYLKRSDSITTSKISKKIFDQIILRDKIKEIIYNEFSLYKYIADEWCFLSRLNICRKLLTNNMTKQYKYKYLELKKYLKQNYLSVKDRLNKKQKIEYFLIIYFENIYPIIMRMILKFHN